MFGSEHNVQVHSDREPEPLFRFRFDSLTELNLKHLFGFGFKHCSECSKPDCGQSRYNWPFMTHHHPPLTHKHEVGVIFTSF